MEIWAATGRRAASSWRFGCVPSAFATNRVCPPPALIFSPLSAYVFVTRGDRVGNVGGSKLLPFAAAPVCNSVQIGRVLGAMLRLVGDTCAFR